VFGLRWRGYPGAARAMPPLPSVRPHPSHGCFVPVRTSASPVGLVDVVTTFRVCGPPDCGHHVNKEPPSQQPEEISKCSGFLLLWQQKTRTFPALGAARRRSAPLGAGGGSGGADVSSGSPVTRPVRSVETRDAGVAGTVRRSRGGPVPCRGLCGTAGVPGSRSGQAVRPPCGRPSRLPAGGPWSAWAWPAEPTANRRIR
jgi:hypothetical protein